MESNDIDDQARNTQSDLEPIDLEYLLEDNQRLVNFLTAGTQEDKQRFIGLLHAKIDREWEVQKTTSQAGRIPRRPDIYAYVQDLGIYSSLENQKKKENHKGYYLARRVEIFSTIFTVVQAILGHPRRIC